MSTPITAHIFLKSLAKGSGGDRYEGRIEPGSGSRPIEVTIYLPQGIARPAPSKPVLGWKVTLEALEGEEAKS